MKSISKRFHSLAEKEENMALIVTIGEILIDLTQTGVNAQGIPQFLANPGGAPANVAVAAARLGADTGFIGCVGQDAFGRFLKETLEKEKVELSGLVATDLAPTTLAVVSVDSTGERSFQFYRKPGADLCLTPESLNKGLLQKADICHFGSVSLTGDPSAEATLAGVKYAKDQGALITYDPNYRANLWPDRETACKKVREVLSLVDVVKISDEETELMTGAQDPEQAAKLLEEQGIQLVLVTLGAQGVLYRFRGHTGTVAGFPTQVADTNGAGDTFFGAVLSCLAGEQLATLEEGRLEEILRLANCAASITTSRPGAIPAMPTMQEVKQKLEQED